MAKATPKDPLVWIDCEMTGLDYKHDKIMEIAVLITDGNLELVDEGIEYVIHVNQEALNKMDEWCTKQHGSSGLTKECLESPNSTHFVAEQVLRYIRKWVPEPKSAVLAGNSVHADRAFLFEEMPEIVDYLHYRIVDVSSIKELCHRWYPSLPRPNLKIEAKHRALDDIKGSIEELRFYRENVFVSPDSLA